MTYQAKSYTKVRNSSNQEFELTNTNPYLGQQKSGALLNNMFNQNILMITIPDELLEKAVKIEKQRCSVQVICICDIIGSFYYIALYPFVGVIILGLSGFGYVSTITYKKSNMLLYVCYQYLIALFRFLNLCLLFLYTIDMLEPMDNVTYYMTNKPEYDLILLSFLFPMQCCIAYHIHSFYNLLPTSDEISQIALSNRYL